MATRDDLAESIIAFAPVFLGREPTWREGTVADFADSLRNADLSRQRVADTIEHTVRKAADMLLGCAPELASALALPRTRKDLKAASLVAALMLSNAALLHHRLRLVPSMKGIVQLKTALDQPTKTGGMTSDPNGEWMKQVARNLTDMWDGFLLGKRYLIHDRDPLFTEAVRGLLRDSGVKPLRLPANSPNLNAYAERFVLSIRRECLDRFVVLCQNSALLK